MQRITYRIVDALWLFGFEVSFRKTEVLHQPIHYEEHRPAHVTIGEVELKSTQQFTYQECIISYVTGIDDEIANRLSKANSSLGRLYKRVWNNKNLNNNTKIRLLPGIYHSPLRLRDLVLLPQLHPILEQSYQCCLCTILNIYGCDVATNLEILEQVEIPSIEGMQPTCHFRKGYIHSVSITKSNSHLTQGNPNS